MFTKKFEGKTYYLPEAYNQDYTISREGIAEIVKGDCWLKFANLKGMDLSGLDLRGAMICNADLSGADLTGCDLSHVTFKGTNLEGANFEGANLWFTDFNDSLGNGLNLTPQKTTWGLFKV